MTNSVGFGCVFNNEIHKSIDSITARLPCVCFFEIACEHSGPSVTSSMRCQSYIRSYGKKLSFDWTQAWKYSPIMSAVIMKSSSEYQIN